jgi:copper(I)-binding protein
MSAEMGAVYMKINNNGSEPDRLVGAECPVAAKVEVHETVMEGDVMKMQHLPEGLEIPAKSQVELKPGGFHLMLIDLADPLLPGVIKCALQFEKSGEIEIDVQIRES